MSSRRFAFLAGSTLACTSAITWISSCGSFSGTSSPATDDATSGDVTTVDAAAVDSAKIDGATASNEAGSVKILASGELNPTAITVGTLGAYWALAGSGEIRRYTFATNGAEDFYSEGKSPSKLAVSPEGIIIGDEGQSKFSVVPEDAVPSASVYPVSLPPIWIAHSATASAIVWTSTLGEGAVNFLDDGNGAEMTVASDEGNPYGIDADSTTLAWCDSARDTIWFAPVSATGFGTPQTITTSAEDCREVAVNGANIYWTEGQSGSVHVSTNESGDSAIVTGQHDPFAIAADATGAYWLERGATEGAGTLWYVAAGTTQPIMLATGDNQLDAGGYFQGIALDATWIYWISYDDGVIKRLAKP